MEKNEVEGEKERKEKERKGKEKKGKEKGIGLSIL